MTHMVHLTLWVRFIFQRCLILLDGWDSCILIRTPHVDGYLKFHTSAHVLHVAGWVCCPFTHARSYGMNVKFNPGSTRNAKTRRLNWSNEKCRKNTAKRKKHQEQKTPQIDLSNLCKTFFGSSAVVFLFETGRFVRTVSDLAGTFLIN